MTFDQELEIARKHGPSTFVVYKVLAEKGRLTRRDLYTETLLSDATIQKATTLLQSDGLIDICERQAKYNREWVYVTINQKPKPKFGLGQIVNTREISNCVVIDSRWNEIDEEFEYKLTWNVNDYNNKNSMWKSEESLKNSLTK